VCPAVDVGKREAALPANFPTYRRNSTFAVEYPKPCGGALDHGVSYSRVVEERISLAQSRVRDVARHVVGDHEERLDRRKHQAVSPRADQVDFVAVVCKESEAERYAA